MQKIKEQVLLRRDKVYQDNEGEVRKRWHFEDAVSLFSLSSSLCYLSFLFNLLVLFLPQSLNHRLSVCFFGNSKLRHDSNNFIVLNSLLAPIWRNPGFMPRFSSSSGKKRFWTSLPNSRRNNGVI